MATPETAAPAADTQTPTLISLRVPSRYTADKATPPTTTTTPFVPPSVAWLTGTWTVTHSTLSMWRSARNVRISYKALPAEAGAAADAPPPIDDLVEYERKSSGAYKSVAGVDRADAGSPGAWDWRGRGWLRFVTSHWEVLGWGERPLTGGAVGDMGTGVERWAVTWFAPTLFTKEGVDIYSDRAEGLSAETVEGIRKALAALDAPAVVAMVEKDLQEVEIKLPWTEKS